MENGRFDTTVGLSLNTAAISFLLLPHQLILKLRRALRLTAQNAKHFSPSQINGCHHRRSFATYYHLIHKQLQKSGHSFLLTWKNY